MLTLFSCTQVQCERLFLKVKIIKNRSRALMGEDLLQAEMLISIKGQYYFPSIKIYTIIDATFDTIVVIMNL